MTRST